MAQKKQEPSFDSLIRLFIEKYDIATKQDINQLADKIDALEKSLSKAPRTEKTVAKSKKKRTAAETVLNVIKGAGDDGASLSDIKAKTKYEGKNLHNIVHRLSKDGKISRKKRGVYVAG